MKLLTSLFMIGILSLSTVDAEAKKEGKYCSGCNDEQAEYLAKHYGDHGDTIFIMDLKANTTRAYKILNLDPEDSPHSNRGPSPDTDTFPGTTEETAIPVTLNDVEYRLSSFLLKNARERGTTHAVNDTITYTGDWLGQPIDAFRALTYQGAMNTMVISTQMNELEQRAFDVINMMQDAFSMTPFAMNVTVKFPDGTSVRIGWNKETGQFEYIPGSALDADNNTIPDSVGDMNGVGYGFSSGANFEDFMNYLTARNFVVTLVNNTGGGGSGNVPVHCVPGPPDPQGKPTLICTALPPPEPE